MNKKVLFSFGLLVTFIFIFPASEYLFLYDDIEEPDALAKFLVGQFLAIILAMIIYSLTYKAPKKIGLIYLSFDSSASDILLQKRIFFLSALFFIVFIVFYIKNVGGFADVALFAERYRNSYYKGSGFFTFGITQFVPLFITFCLVKSKKLTVYFYFSLVFAFVASLLLGLRIFLLIVYIFAIVRLLSGEKILRNFTVLLILVFFAIAYKLILADGLSSKGISDIFLHISGRISYRHYIHESGFYYGIFETFGALNPFMMFSDCNVNCYKAQFAELIPNLTINKPEIRLLSGIAIPLPIILYNSFGVFYFPFVSMILLVFLKFTELCYRENRNWLVIIYLYFSYLAFVVLSEDIQYFQKTPIVVVILLLTMVFINFARKVRFVWRRF